MATKNACLLSIGDNRTSLWYLDMQSIRETRFSQVLVMIILWAGFLQKVFQMGASVKLCQAYLPGVEVNHDHEGGSSRVRPFHCTQVGLTPTITPNVGNSNA